ncbi:uncharacterized protein IUM83_00406 [Phytophthora cinnamomi]|uniref:uncharacterized protein n=1 Tax=Phytophthora cinnamomi TaxID=4785 RepID=UPI00355976B8|nr:hypothetical protein IUM83_00406 [Phytophthora cinnamomi]
MAATLLLRVRGVGGVEGTCGWPWLRARMHSGEGAQGRLLLDQCLLGRGGGGQREWGKGVVVELQSEEAHGAIAFELWTGQSRSTDLLEFAAGWTVDLALWMESGKMERWYPIAPSRGRHAEDSKPKGSEYCQNKTELLSTAAYVCVSLAMAGNSLDPTLLDTKETDFARKSGFRFVLPRRPLARSSKLRAVRVGQIVHELRTDTLRDLLPLTLYGSLMPICNLLRPRTGSIYLQVEETK